MLIALSLVFLCSGCGKKTPMKQAHEPVPALEYGWKLTTFETDPFQIQFLTEPQQKLALEYLSRGDLNRAVEIGTQISDWRKGVVMGSCVARLALDGETAHAMDLLADLKEYALTVTDWPGDRVRMQIAKAQAILKQKGDFDVMKEWYRKNEQYREQVVAYDALCTGLEGNLREAINTMTMSEAREHEALIWKTEGFLMLGEVDDIPLEEAREIVSKANAAARRVPGNMKFDLLLKSADLAWELLPEDEALKMSNELTDEILESKWQPNVKAHLVAKTMLLWAENGRADKVEQVASMAETLAEDKGLNLEERNVHYSRLGEAYARAGMEEDALRCFNRAIDIALNQKNPRPRAVYGVNVSLALARSGFDFERVRERMDKLIGTFRPAEQA